MKKRSTKTPEEKQSEAYGRWYKRHREEFNRQRRERYKKDPELRAKMVESARKRRETLRKQKQAAGPPKREVNGKLVRVYTITEVAERIGRTAETIRSWEAAGLIPATLFGTRVRWYTYAQIKLLRWLVAQGKKAKHARQQAEIYQQCVDRLFAEWENTK